MQTLKLYMLLLGCRPKGRNTEQHDIFFSIGTSLYDLIGDIKAFWPEVKGNIHLDAWREVNQVDGFKINITPRDTKPSEPVNKEHQLFFINLGGYKDKEFEEYHYKVLTVAPTLDEAKLNAKKTAFFKHVGIKGAPSHIDDKFGVDVDDMDKVEDILPAHLLAKYSIQIVPDAAALADELILGYVPLYKITKEQAST